MTFCSNLVWIVYILNTNKILDRKIIVICLLGKKAVSQGGGRAGHPGMESWPEQGGH